MEHRAPLTPEAAATISALTTPRSPIVDPLVARLEDLHREIAEADAVRRELDALRRVVWVLAYSKDRTSALRITDRALAAVPDTFRLSAYSVPGAIEIEARS